MATREKGRRKTKQAVPQEASQQYKVMDPISIADLENIHTRRGKYPSTLHLGQKLGNWPEGKKRNECLKKGKDP